MSNINEGPTDIPVAMPVQQDDYIQGGIAWTEGGALARIAELEAELAKDRHYEDDAEHRIAVAVLAEREACAALEVYCSGDGADGIEAYRAAISARSAP